MSLSGKGGRCSISSKVIYSKEKGLLLCKTNVSLPKQDV
jgi:hypothetical protein